MSKLKLLLAASEVVPFAKTGGLADVAGSLPIALEEMGVDVRVIMPKYGCVKLKGDQTVIGKGVKVYISSRTTIISTEKSCTAINSATTMITWKDSRSFRKRYSSGAKEKIFNPTSYIVTIGRRRSFPFILIPYINTIRSSRKRRSYLLSITLLIREYSRRTNTRR